MQLAAITCMFLNPKTHFIFPAIFCEIREELEIKGSCNLTS